MRFIYPQFLFALSALAIPIIIHLFNFRRFKKVYFTNVRFLREIKQDTQSRSRLKHLLILFSRMLALTFLVLAFAQPFIPSSFQKTTGTAQRVSVYIDNSYSMDAVGKNGNLLEMAKRKAREIAGAYRTSDQFQLLTSDFEGRHQRLMNRDEFLKLVDEVKPGSSTRTFSEVIQRQEQALSANGEKISRSLYLISDHQRSSADIASIKADTSSSVFFIPLEASRQNNLSIDSCYLEKPFVQLNSPASLHVKIRNYGNTDVENVPIKLLINGIQKAVGSVNVSAGSVAEAVLSFTLNEAGWQRAQVNITDYPVTFDDDYYFSFNIRPKIDVMSINGNAAGNAVNAVFGNDEYFNLRNTPAGQIDYSSFSTMQLIVLNELDNVSSGLAQELKKYLDKGGSIFIIPSSDIDLSSYRSLAEVLNIQSYSGRITANDKVSRIETRHPLFNDVFEKGKGIPENMDLPVVNNPYVFSSGSARNSQPVMSLQSGNPFLIASFRGKGNVYAIATGLSPENGNFARHALFVPVMLRAALRNSSEINPPMTIGHSNEFTITDTVVSADNVFHLINESLKFDVIPETKILSDNTVLSIHNQVTKAGNYDVKAGNSVLAVMALNYDRKESDLATLNEDELQSALAGKTNLKAEVIDSEGKDLSHSITQMNEGKRFWKYCVIAALIFLALEIILIRFFKPTPQKA